jgi:hypothetical protein
MHTQRIEPSVTLLGLEWIARVGSLVSIGLLMALFIGEGFHPAQIAPQEWTGLLFFPVGVVLGMIIAWWKEGAGATITLTSLAAFYVVYGYLLRNHIGGWFFIAFAAPGFLFLLHWLLLRKTGKT